MRGRAFSVLSIGIICMAGFMFMLSTSSVANASTSTLGAITTVTGWLIPDGTHFNNGIGALLFPIVGIGLFAGMGRLLGLEGDFGVTLVLAGLTVGGLLAMLSLNANSNNVLPFSLVIIPGVDLVIWQWKGGG